MGSCLLISFFDVVVSDYILCSDLSYLCLFLMGLIGVCVVWLFVRMRVCDFESSHVEYVRCRFGLSVIWDSGFSLLDVFDFGVFDLWCC